MSDPTVVSGKLGEGAVVESFHNYSGSDIAAGVVVKYDGSNDATASALAGIAPTSATTDAPLGVTLEKIRDGADGRVVIGGAMVAATAKGAVTFGQSLMAGSTSGTCSTRTPGKPQLGKCFRTAADGATTLVFVNVVDPS